MNSNMPCYCNSSPSAVVSKCNQQNGNNRAQNDSSSASIEGPLFSIYMNPDLNSDVPSAIMDSGSCCSVVGVETLTLAMTKLGLSELKDEDICQKEHLFGPSNEQMKIICAIRVLCLFVCSSFQAKDLVLIHVRCNVIGIIAFFDWPTISTSDERIARL